MAIEDKEYILKLFDEIRVEIKYIRSLSEYFVGILDTEFEALRNKFIDAQKNKIYNYKEQVEKFLMGIDAHIVVIRAC